MTWICKHCSKSFNLDKPSQKANHSRWCESNPKRSIYADALKNARSAINTDSIERMKASVKKAWQEGNYQSADHGKGFRGKKHTDETKALIKAKALASNHRRLVRKPIMYNGILLDGTWELTLAKRLDYLKVKWIRPNPLKWIDADGLEHNYFPDFYLPDYDLYLDPKNPQAFKVQRNKIEILDRTYNNIIWLKTLDDCKNFWVHS